MNFEMKIYRSIAGLTLFMIFMSQRQLQGSTVCTKNSTLDITFVLDASSSIGEDSFQNGLKPAVKGLINLLIPGSNDSLQSSRVACVVFSTDSRVEWNFKDYTTKEEISKAVDRIDYDDDYTNTGDALYQVLTQLHPQVRPDVKHLVILITDGDQSGGSHDWKEVSREMKRAGIIIFVIGVGSSVKQTDLDEVASGPKFRADSASYESLAEETEKFVQMTCIKPADFISSGKATTQSSVENDGFSHLAIDELNNTCIHTQKEKAPWWRIDLGSVHKITKVIIRNGGNERLNSVRVQISKNQRAWRIVGRLSEKNKFGGEYIIPVQNDGQYVQLIKSNRVPDHLDFCEVEVFGTPIQE
jgi:hypothetical protein